MKISTKGRYSVRFLIDLVLYGSKGPVLVKDIARRQEISEKYLGHIIPLLKSASLINAVRGAHGGVTLARSPKEVTLKDIIEAVEGPICLVGCVQNPLQCKRAGRCAVKDVWAEATSGIIKVLEGFTLEAMAEEQRQKAEVFSYEI